jgi:hypothetical protein
MFKDNHTEMLFNMTAAGAPVVRQIATSNALLNRCRYVSNLLLAMFYSINVLRFWESVGNLTGQ